MSNSELSNMGSKNPCDYFRIRAALLLPWMFVDDGGSGRFGSLPICARAAVAIVVLFAAIVRKGRRRLGFENGLISERIRCQLFWYETE